MAYLRCTGTSGGSLKLRTAQGEIASFETNIVAPLQSVTVDIEATGGNGTPDNPNPINGYSSANITRCGKNLFDKTDNTMQNNARIATSTGGTYGAAGYSVSPYIKVDNSKTYVLTSGIQSYYAAYDENKTFIGGGSWNDGASKTFLATVAYVRFDFQTADIGTVQLEQGSTSTAYTPYNGQTYTIAFGQTVYGGVLDVTRGKLHVTHGKYTLDDVSNLSRNSDHSFYFGATPKPKTTGTAYYTGVMSDKFTPGETANQDVIFIHPNGLVRFNTYNAYQSTSDCFTAIGNITVVYPLDTPFDIDLTPVQIEQLLGKNNVYHDCNGNTEVKYIDLKGEEA